MNPERLELTSAEARSLAESYGTPLYVLDEGVFRARIRRYLSAFRCAWPDSRLSYASKANSTIAVLRIAYEEGCTIDVASEGELEAALRAGVPPVACHLHGNAKLPRELERAVELQVGQVMVDHPVELEELARMEYAGEVMLRLAPGVNPETHPAISTGHIGAKFGVPLAEGLARAAWDRGVSLGLRMRGVHNHVGSQLLNPAAQIEGGQALARFAREFGGVSEINLGGGMGVAYTEDQSPVPVEAYCRSLVSALGDLPSGVVLSQEPGRSLIADAGVTLYSVIVRKELPSGLIFIGVDGGMSDNPRPALYGAPYSVRAHRAAGELRRMTVVGRHCEADTLFPDVLLPAGVGPGTLLEVRSTGAYNQSMASNYNRFCRPACVLRSGGSARVIQRRETLEDLFARE